MTPEEKAELIVERIIVDLESRKGLRQTWEEIDGDVICEIVDDWRAIAFEVVSKND